VRVSENVRLAVLCCAVVSRRVSCVVYLLVTGSYYIKPIHV
jgi:hypothetical protein